WPNSGKAVTIAKTTTQAIKTADLIFIGIPPELTATIAPIYSRPFLGQKWRDDTQPRIPSQVSGHPEVSCKAAASQNDPLPNSVEHNIRSAVQSKLLHEIGTMGFNRQGAEV